MSTWNNFYKLTNLSLYYADSSDSNKAFIFANNKNQVKVGIRIRAEDKSKKPLDITLNDLSDIIFLCDSKTGNEIDKSKWTFSKSDLGYAQAFSYSGYFNMTNRGDNSIYTRKSSHSSSNGTKNNDNSNLVFRKGTDGSIYIERYISASKENEDGYRFSVSINIPGFGVFNTSDNGTTTPNGPESSSPFKSPISLKISTLESINYGIPGKVKFSNTDFSTISENLGWTSLSPAPFPIYKEHYNGVCKSRIVYIQPENDKIKIKKYSLSYNKITDDELNKGEILIDWNGGSDQKGIEIINPEYHSPCAIVGKGGGDYQVNLWFGGRNNIYNSGHFFLADSWYTYRFAPYVKQEHANDDEKGFITLLLYKFILPENNAGQACWHDVIHPVTIDLTDTYGNTGKFNLVFNDSDHFDVPGIS